MSPLILFFFIAGSISYSTSSRCAFRNVEKQEEEDCQACYAVWQKSGQILEQGCLKSSSLNCIQDAQCIHDPSLQIHPRWTESEQKVCCCRDEMCNELPKEYEEGIHQTSYFLIPISILVLSLVFLSLIFIYKKTKKKPFKMMMDIESSKPNDKLLEPAAAIMNLDLSMDHILKNHPLEEGEFLVQLEPKGEQIAIKKFNHAMFYQRERQVYQVLSQNHCFRRFYGAYESPMILCLEPAPQNLASYLRENTLNWHQLSQVLANISQGVTLLHDNKQATICHRDLNTFNILVRRDLSCCISNFTHAMVFEGKSRTSQQPSNAFECHGNVRYFAPEILDQCLNLTSLETALKQTDVYALGLLFWETSRRCHDLYPCPVPPFELAYTQELGSDAAGTPDVSFEQMKILVAKNRARPLFPQVWKDSNPAIQLLKETITESWDDDGEARLTTCCILERFQELNSLWSNYKLVSQGPPSVDKSWLNNTHQSKSAASDPGLENIERNPSSKSREKNGNIESGQRPTVRIQPHQGLNPCLERNFCIHLENDILITGSAKDKKILLPKATDSLPPQQPRILLRQNQPIPYLVNNIGTNGEPSKKNVNLEK